MIKSTFIALALTAAAPVAFAAETQPVEVVIESKAQLEQLLSKSVFKTKHVALVKCLRLLALFAPTHLALLKSLKLLLKRSQRKAANSQNSGRIRSVCFRSYLSLPKETYPHRKPLCFLQGGFLRSKSCQPIPKAGSSYADHMKTATSKYAQAFY